MSGQTTGELMGAVAGRIDLAKDTVGLMGVSYPAINTVPASPWGMVRQSPLAPSTIEKARAGVQVVRTRIDVVLLVVSDPSSPSDAARLDGLVEPILDLFDANANGGNVNAAFTGLLDWSVDHIWHEAFIRRMPLKWGEAGYCHAAIITMDSEFQRKAVLP